MSAIQSHASGVAASHRYALPGSAALAAPVSPFTAMAGTWSGGGVLSTTDGQQEQLRCRASYDVAGTGEPASASI